MVMSNGEICLRDILTATIKASVIDCHDSGRIVSRELNIHSSVSCSFNNVEQFPPMSLSIHSTVKQTIDKINSLLTCLRRARAFSRNGRWILSCRWTFYRLA